MEKRFYSVAIRIFILLIGSVIFNACGLFVSFDRTLEGGYKVKNSNRLKFYGKQFQLSNSLQLDTNAIYVFSNYELPTAKPFDIEISSYCRFFPNGQVLFANCDTIPSAAVVNNPELGWQGYYKIKKDKLKIREFEITNGGMIGLRWGHFQNGDILFYSNTPRTHFYSWKAMEKQDRKERWRKVKIDGIKPLKLNW